MLRFQGKKPAKGKGKAGPRKPSWPFLALIGLAFFGGILASRWFGTQLPEHEDPKAVAVLPAPPAPIVVPPAVTPPAEPVPSPALPPAAAPAWQRYASPAPARGQQPRVAIVIDDCGLDRPRTERAITLPAAVTLSFIPYASELPRQTAAARRNGHELLVHVPMQPLNAHLDMGPNGLAVDLSHDEILRRLRWDLARFDGYVGINNHMGSRFTTDAEGMGWMLAELKARGLLFLDSRTVANSAGERVAEAEDVPFASRDVFLDDDQKAVAVEAQLREVEKVARKKGTAIAIGHPHDATLTALAAWLAALPQEGITAVPLTAIVKARMTIE